MAFAQKTMKVNAPVYRELTEVKKILESRVERQVAFTEVISALIAAWKQRERLIAEVQASGE